MSQKTIRINTHIPGVPEWLKVNGSVSIPLPLKSVREMALKLAEVTEDDHVILEIGVAKGKEVTVDFNFSATPKPAEAGE